MYVIYQLGVKDADSDVINYSQPFVAKDYDHFVAQLYEATLDISEDVAERIASHNDTIYRVGTCSKNGVMTLTKKMSKVATVQEVLDKYSQSGTEEEQS